jgi:hypothetical protein
MDQNFKFHASCMKKKWLLFSFQCQTWSPKSQFVLNNKIEFYFIKLNINLILGFFLIPQEPHNKLMKTNYQIQFLINVM